MFSFLSLESDTCSARYTDFEKLAKKRTPVDVEYGTLDVTVGGCVALLPVVLVTGNATALNNARGCGCHARAEDAGGRAPASVSASVGTAAGCDAGVRDTTRWRCARKGRAAAEAEAEAEEEEEEEEDILI